MRVTITIDCDNSAFEDSPSTEVARILTEYATRLRDGMDSLSWADGAKLRDINGNTVGSVAIDRAHGEDSPSEPIAIHSTCKHCDQDIEGYAGDPEWLDRGSDSQCAYNNRPHEPMDEDVEDY